MTDGQTDRQNCYINIVRQCADARYTLTRDKKLEWLSYRVVKKLRRYIKLFRFNTGTWRTDRRTDRHNSIPRSRVSIANQQICEDCSPDVWSHWLAKNNYTMHTKCPMCSLFFLQTSREFLSFSPNGLLFSLFIICITPMTIFSPSNIGMLSKLLIINPSFSAICK